MYKEKGNHIITAVTRTRLSSIPVSDWNMAIG